MNPIRIMAPRRLNVMTRCNVGIASGGGGSLFRPPVKELLDPVQVPTTARGIAFDKPDQDDCFGLEERPLDTAVYIPDDEKNKYGGGFAIYLRHGLDLLQNHVGIGLDPASDASVHDLRVLTMIDRLPSLDPFLLKSQCDTEGPAYEAKVAIAPADEKASVSARPTAWPIVKKAKPEGSARAPRTVERFLDATWKPCRRRRRFSWRRSRSSCTRPTRCSPKEGHWLLRVPVPAVPCLPVSSAG